MGCAETAPVRQTIRSCIARLPAVGRARRSDPAFTLETQRQSGTGIHSPLCMLQQLAAQLPVLDHGIAPLVEPDPLGEELGAEAVSGARDRVEGQLLAHAEYAASREVVGRTRR